MATVRVERFTIKKAKSSADDLQQFLQAMVSDGWTVVAVTPEGLKAKGAGFSSQRIVSYLVVVSR